MQTGLSSILKVGGREGTDTTALLVHLCLRASILHCMRQAWLLLSQMFPVYEL